MKVFLLFISILCHTVLYAESIEDAKKLFDDEHKYKESIEIFKKYPNDSETQYYLSKAYLYGYGVNKDLKKAFYYAKLSANQNNSSGVNILGVMYQYGEGVEKNELQAHEYYKKASLLDNTKAMLNLGNLYIYSNEIQPNPQEAQKMYEKALKLGNLEANCRLGDLNYYNFENDSKALIYLIACEKSQHIQPYQYQLIGRIYDSQKNYIEAYSYLKKAIDLKQYAITYKLFDIAFEKGLTENQNEALQYLQIAVDNNDSMSTQAMERYLIDTKKDLNGAIKLLKKSYYEHGNIESGCSLATYLSFNYFIDGINFLQTYNPNESVQISNEIISKYPQNPKTFSCFTNLAYLYRNGSFLAKNEQKAIAIYKKALDLDTYPSNKQRLRQWTNEIEQNLVNKPLNYEIKDDKILFTFINNFSNVNQVVSVLNTKNYYFISTSDKSIKIIDKNTLKIIRELRGYISNGADGIVTTMAFDEKNKLLYCSGINSSKKLTINNIIKAFDIKTGKVVKTIFNKNAIKNTFLNISQDGKILVAINNNTLVNIINTTTDTIQHYDLGTINKFYFADVMTLESDYRIRLLSNENNIYTISYNLEKMISTKESFTNQIDIKSRTYISNEIGNKILENFEKFIPIEAVNRQLQISLSNNKFLEFDTVKLDLNKLSSNANINNNQSNSNISIRYLDGGSTLEIFKDNKKTGLINFGDQKAVYHKIINNQYIFVANTDYTTQAFFNLYGNPILQLDNILYLQKHMTESDKYLITFGEDNVIHIWNKNILDNSSFSNKHDENILKDLSLSFGGDPTEMIKDEYSNEELFAIQNYLRLNYELNSDKLKSYFKFFMSRKNTIKPLVSLYIINEKDWIMYTPEGLFTYGGNGKDLIKYHQNQGLYKEAKIIENDQLFDKFYRPDLIKKILAGEKADIPMDVKSVILNIKPPRLNILDHVLKNKKDLDITYQICDDGNGIANPKLIINGQAINPPQSRAFTIESKNNDCKLYKSSLTLYPGESQILLKAFDKDGYISNTSDILELKADYKIVEKSKKTDKSLSKNSDDLVLEKGNLYFVSLAVSDYEDKNMNLKFPVSDVLSVQQSFVKNSNQTFEHIYSYHLGDSNVTLENFNTTIEKIVSQMKMNDTFVLYLAGHGTTIEGKYQFIPYTIGKKISIDSIKDNFSKIAAYTNKSLVMLDTCYSGAIIDNLNDKATTNRLAHDSNINYIVASSSDQVALEGYQNHGVFTYSVLEAFEKGDTLKVWSLADYISEVVPKITQQEFHFEQNPQVFKANDFSLGGRE